MPDVKRPFGSAPAAEPKVDTSKLVRAPHGVGGCFTEIDGVRYWHPDFGVPKPVDSHGYPQPDEPEPKEDE